MTLISKLILLLIYVAALVSPFLPTLTKYSQGLIAVAILMFFIHIVEYFALRKRFAEKQPGKNHLIGVLLFGVIYSMPILKP